MKEFYQLVVFGIVHCWGEDILFIARTFAGMNYFVC